MDGRYGLYGQNSGLWGSLRDGDFEEDDVWDILKERTSASSFKICPSMEPPPSSSSSYSSSSSSGSLPLLPAAKMIPVPSSNGRNNQDQKLRKSAPVTIPQWPQSYPKKSNKTSWDNDDDGDGEEEEEEEDDDGDKLPPHEYIARSLARSHISSFSVFEGIGRTLKGRDLSKVRNAILTKTGFLE